MRKLTTGQARELAAMRKIHSGGAAGRPRSTQRCPCGVMTRARANKRRHVCYATPDARKK